MPCPFCKTDGSQARIHVRFTLRGVSGKHCIDACIVSAGLRNLSSNPEGPAGMICHLGEVHSSELSAASISEIPRWRR